MAKRANPDLLSDRAKRDVTLKPKIERVWKQNYKVYGVRKVWHQMRREAFDIARCTVARLMKDIGIEGIIRGKKHRTTIPDKSQPCPLDKVNRQFKAPAPINCEVISSQPLAGRAASSVRRLRVLSGRQHAPVALYQPERRCCRSLFRDEFPLPSGSLKRCVRSPLGRGRRSGS